MVKVSEMERGVLRIKPEPTLTEKNQNFLGYANGSRKKKTLF